MPNIGGNIYADPRQVEKVKLLLSSQFYAGGSKVMKNPKTGFSPSNSEIFSAKIGTASLLPSSISLPLPPVQNQGAEGACIAFATTMAKNINYYVVTGASSYSTSTNIFSIEYVFNQAKVGDDCTTGTVVPICLDLMVNQGVCFWDTMPQAAGCTTQPNNTQRAEAALYKISGYTRMIAGDRAAIKTQLAANNPVIFTLSVDSALYNAGPGFIWNAENHASSSGITIDHGAVIVGYDDSINAYKMMNSWGTSWGDAGFAWIDYEFFESYAAISYYVYTIDGIPLSNTAPVANAGLDQTVSAGNSATLNGSGSYDPDGYLATFAWTQVSGPNTATINNSSSAVASATGLIAGTYVFKLTVTDDSAATAVDTVTVTVVASESVSLTLSKSSSKGKFYHNLSWNISLNNYPISGVIEYKTSPSSMFSSLYNIVPYSPQGTFSYQVSKRVSYSYRLKVVRSDGSIVYSNIVT